MNAPIKMPFLTRLSAELGRPTRAQIGSFRVKDESMPLQEMVMLVWSLLDRFTYVCRCSHVRYFAAIEMTLAWKELCICNILQFSRCWQVETSLIRSGNIGTVSF